METRLDRRRDHTVAMRDLMPGRSRQPIDGHVRNAGAEAGVSATLVFGRTAATGHLSRRTRSASARRTREPAIP